MTEEDIGYMIKVGGETGGLDTHQEELLSSAIEFSPLGGNFCRGKDNQAQVLMTNKTTNPIVAHVWAESPVLLPAFDEDTITLAPLEQRYLTMRFYSGTTTNTGTYEVNLYAQTRDETVKRNASLTISDCSGQSTPNFYIVPPVPGNCSVIDRGFVGTIRTEISNLLPSPVSVNLDVKNPNRKDDLVHLPPQELAENILVKEKQIVELMDEIKSMLAKGS